MNKKDFLDRIQKRRGGAQLKTNNRNGGKK
jgi:hypothetical protein